MCGSGNFNGLCSKNLTHQWKMGSRLLHGVFISLILVTIVFSAHILWTCVFSKPDHGEMWLVDVVPTNQISVNLHFHGEREQTFLPTNDSLISTVDWQYLTETLQWPLPPETLSSLSDSTDPARCSFSITNNRSQYFVGDVVIVTITARNANNKQKVYGGDFFQAKLYDQELKASAYGEVTDHDNGTYTARLVLLWPGKSRVSVRLVHPSEAVLVLTKNREQDPDKVYFSGYFEEGTKRETVICNALKSSRLVGDGSQCCCEYKDQVSGEYWYCRRPSSLSCNTLVYHSMGGYQAKLSELEASLLKRSTNVEIQSDQPVIHAQKQGNDKRTQNWKKCQPGLQTPIPSGFFFQDGWTSLVCDARQFTTAETVSTCLKDKQILMMGDSTLRQWFEHLEKTVPSLKRLNLHTSDKSGPFESVDLQSNTRIIWRTHGLPLRTSKTPLADLHYIASELEGLAGGKHCVVVFTIWAHFTTYPLGVYLHRLAIIRRAVSSLLRRAPDTLVLIKSANTGYKDVYGSDWLSWQLDKALRVMFRDVPVVLIDVWQMTSCHYSPDNIHPPPVVVKNEVDLFLSFVCS
ncbi:NXPE family member 3-like isoform X1 [Osmerus eperlanus]|uniref:NXPE family member 3-like isoform X1 n=2 Tax=Osmerus eperlanus TaxID=29151 RepID=UPI002E13A43C